MSYIDENSNLKPCPWCGTTLGYYTGKYLQGATHKFYKFTHFTSRCNMTIETEWCPSKEECDGMWNDRAIGFFCNQSKRGKR